MTRSDKQIGRCALAALGFLASPSAILAQSLPYHLAPLTKLHLNVVQFIPATGDYRRWDALGGDLVVSPDGTVLVPALGPIPAADVSAEQLAADIARKLQVKLGLVDPPDATIQVLDYPPIYLVGGVAVPGQYPFRPGMTVLQALALGGGQYRGDSTGNPSDTIKLQSEMQGIGRDILRSTARLARLDAELSGDKEVAFPDVLDADDPTIVAIMNQERTIFAARQNEFGRQSAGLSALADLYRAELDVLEQKSQSVEEQLAQALEQLGGVKQLVEKGNATVSRLADVERAVAGLRSDRLDNLIATMNARENLNHSVRDLAKLEDDQHTQASVELQAEQITLERLQLNQTTTLRLLRQATEFAAGADSQNGQVGLAYIIVRQEDGRAVEVAASETSTMLPGDLLKVTMMMGTAPLAAVADGMATASAALP